MPQVCRTFSKTIARCISKCLCGSKTVIPEPGDGFPFPFPYPFDPEDDDTPQPGKDFRMQINITRKESTESWNNIDIRGGLSNAMMLLYPDGTDSGMTFTVLTEGQIEGIEGIDDTLVLDPDPDFPYEVIEDYFYQANVVPKVMRIDGATPGKEYEFTFAFVPHSSDFGIMDINYDVNGENVNISPMEEVLIKTELKAKADDLGRLVITLDVYTEDYNMYSMVGAILIKWKG